MIDFVSIGEQTISEIPTLRCLPLAEPNAGALYRRRLEALRTCTEEYLCFVDGGGDIVLPGFVDAMNALASSGQPLGYARELVNGESIWFRPFTLNGFLVNHTIIHHGVVCKVEELRKIEWPRGCYSWEVIAYGTLAQKGFVIDPEPRYDWRPDSDGARLWPSYTRSVVNSKGWFKGVRGAHFRSDFE